MQLELDEKEILALEQLVVNELDFVEDEISQENESQGDWEETKIFWEEVQRKLNERTI